MLFIATIVHGTVVTTVLRTGSPIILTIHSNPFFVQVSDSGDVLYVLPSNFRQIIAGKSWLLRAEPFLQKVRDASAYLVRVTFGTALITSVILVWVTIVAILSSSGKDDDRRYGCTSTLATANIMLPLLSVLSNVVTG